MIHQMGTLEISSFLVRHPETAAQVSITRTVQALGLYDVNAYDEAIQIRFPGVIKPWGLQVQDETYGLVTIQPTNTTIFFTADSPVDVGADQPDYTPPSQKCRNGENAIMGFCPEDLTDVLKSVAIGLAVIYLAGHYISKKG